MASKLCNIVIATVLGVACWTLPARAQTVEVAPGIRVTKKTYPVPVNEQPFFGFAEKTPAQKKADSDFLAVVDNLKGTDAFAEAIRAGNNAIQAGQFDVAARRLNQAYLIKANDSRLYHLYAIVVQARFNDTEYAEELFKVAGSQPNPLPLLKADHARLLLMAKRPKEALPLLEQAVVDAPEFPTAWSNLAFARAQTGDARGACEAVVRVSKLQSTPEVRHDVALLTKALKCEPT